MAVPQASLMSILRGDTWTSPKYMTFEEDMEDVFPDFTPTWDDIADAIADMRLTPKDLRGYEIESDVKIGGAIWFKLSDYKVINSDGTKIHFELTAEQTKELETVGAAASQDLPITGSYDIQLCKAGVVETVFRGDVVLIADITERTPCS